LKSQSTGSSSRFRSCGITCKYDIAIGALFFLSDNDNDRPSSSYFAIFVRRNNKMFLNKVLVQCLSLILKIVAVANVVVAAALLAEEVGG